MPEKYAHTIDDQIKLTDVRAFTSEADLLAGDSIPYAARAVERSHAYGNFQFFVFAPGMGGTRRSASSQVNTAG